MNQQECEILMNEYVDGVISDEQMQILFHQLSLSSEYRKSFSSLLNLRGMLNAISAEHVPTHLDVRIQNLVQKNLRSQTVERFSFNKIFHKKISISTPVFATVLALVIIGTTFLSVKIFSVFKPTQTEYVYIMQLPQIEVHEVNN